MILHSLTDKSCKILQSPSQNVMQDLSGMISPDIVPKSVVILHTKSCKIIEVFNPRSCFPDITGIIMRDLSRLFRHDLTRYSSIICSDLACTILHHAWQILKDLLWWTLQNLARIFSWEVISHFVQTCQIRYQLSLSTQNEKENKMQLSLPQCMQLVCVLLLLTAHDEGDAQFSPIYI